MLTPIARSPLRSHLPAIYQAPGDEAEAAIARDDPVAALLDAFEMVLRPSVHTIDTLEWYFDPSITPPAMAALAADDEDAPAERLERDPEFLAWLAAWVGVDVNEVEAAETSGDPARRLDLRRRQLVRRAANLYRRRGTVVGLTELLHAFYEVDVQVHEWRWPQGMRIGLSSVIGVDTVLTPPADVRHSFVVVWRPQPWERFRDILDAAPWWLTVVDERGHPRARVRAGMLVDREESDRHEDRYEDGSAKDKRARLAAFRTKAERIGRAVAREKPAHTHAYVALAWEEPGPPADPMIIGVTSIIGHSRIADKVDNGIQA